MAASSNMVVCCIYLVCSKCQGYVYWFLYHLCILNKYHWARKTAAYGLLAFCAEDRVFFRHCPWKPLKSSFAFCTCACVVPTPSSGDILMVTGWHEDSQSKGLPEEDYANCSSDQLFCYLWMLFLMDYKRWEFFVFLVVSRGHEFWVDLNVMKLYETVEFDQMRRLSTPSCPSSSSNYYTVWKYFCRDHFGWREYSEVFNTFQNPAFGL